MPTLDGSFYISLFCFDISRNLFGVLLSDSPEEISTKENVIEYIIFEFFCELGASLIETANPVLREFSVPLT